MPGHCGLQVRHDTNDPEFVGPWFTENSVPCGDTADVCGTPVRCDCRPVAQWSCGDAGREPYMRMHSFDAGDNCVVSLEPPSDGTCRGSVTYFGSSGTAEGFVDIPVNQTRRICRGKVEQRCVCEDFARRCTFDIQPPERGRCVVKYTSCRPSGCEEIGMWLDVGEAGEVCGQTVRCAEQDGGVGVRPGPPTCDDGAVMWSEKENKTYQLEDGGWQECVPYRSSVLKGGAL